MKAFLIDRYAKGAALRLGEVPEPELRENDVLVQIHASGVNVLDNKIRDGEFKLVLPYRLPLILGNDVAGVVVQVGSKVQRFKPGDDVYARPAKDRIGTFAEFIAMNEADVAMKPKNLTMEEAASVPLVALTAWQVLVERANLKKGQKVLIHAGSGGVGTIAIQLAKHIGARVITTASANNHDYVRMLGASRAIDYNKEDFTAAAAGCDVVFDTVGGEVQMKSYAVLRPGGRLVWIAPAPAGSTPPRKDVEVLRPRVARDRAHLERMLELLEAGAVRPPAITEYKLADAAEAHRVSEGRHLQGKLVLMV